MPAQSQQESYTELEYRWFCNAASPVSQDNPVITLLLDLDETTFFLETGNEDRTQGWAAAHPKFSDKRALFLDNKKYPCYIDPDVFLKIKAFCDNGHQLIIITCGLYQFTHIQELFTSFNITIQENQFYNRDSMFMALPNLKNLPTIPHKLKAIFIGILWREFQTNIMLFDNNINNIPKNCLFRYADPKKPFPLPDSQKLNAITQNKDNFLRDVINIKKMQQKTFILTENTRRDEILTDQIKKFVQLNILMHVVNAKYSDYVPTVTNIEIAEKLLRNSGLSAKQLLTLFSIERESKNNIKCWRHLFFIRSFMDYFKSLRDNPEFEPIWQKCIRLYGLPELLLFYRNQCGNEFIQVNDWGIILQNNQPIKIMARIVLLKALRAELLFKKDGETSSYITRLRDNIEKNLTNDLYVFPLAGDIERILQKQETKKPGCPFFSKRNVQMREISNEAKQYFEIAKKLGALIEDTTPLSRNCVSRLTW